MGRILNLFWHGQFHTSGNITLIYLTDHESAIIDTEDLPKVVNFMWYAFRSPQKTYCAAMTKINGKKKVILLHRILAGPQDNLVVDHKNHNGLDCRKDNLRICNDLQNGQNRKSANKNSKSGVRGVCFCKNRWQVWIKVGECRYTKNFPGTEDGYQQAVEHVKNKRKELQPFSTN